MAGRHRKLTDARTEVLLNALRLGNTRRAAAGAAEIGTSTFYRMLDDDGTFRDAVEKAEADAEVRFAALVARAAEQPGTWQAAAWWLERRRPDDYGRRERIDVSFDVRKEAERVAASMGLDPAEVVAAAEAIIAERAAER